MARAPTDPRYIGIDFDTLYDKILVYAGRKLREHSYVPYCAYELAQRSFLHLHTNWHPSQCSALKFLEFRVDHIINDYFRSGEFKYNSSIDENKLTNYVEKEPCLEQHSPNYNFLYERETIELLKYIKNRHIGAHALASWILIKDIEDLTEIAVLMNLYRHQVEYYKKRLRSIMREYLSEEENKSSPATRLIKLVAG